MSDIRNSGRLVGIMLAVILLSFFGATQEKLPGNTIVRMSEAESGGTDTVITVATDAGKASDCETKIIAIKGMLDDVVMSEQKTVHVMPIRFIAVVCALLCAIWIVYCIAIRRFGGRMIALWENIVYIHQIDGEKGNACLDT